MTFIVPNPDDSYPPGPIDSGDDVACMVEGCGGIAAVMWVDTFHPWVSVLCATHGRDSLPSSFVIATHVYFDECPDDLRTLADERSALLWRHHEEHGW